MIDMMYNIHTKHDSIKALSHTIIKRIIRLTECFTRCAFSELIESHFQAVVVIDS